MEFGGAHVWKTSHPQAMEFFRTQNLLTVTLEFCTQSFLKGGDVPSLNFVLFFNIFAIKLQLLIVQPPILAVIQALHKTSPTTGVHKVVLLPKKIATHHSYMDTSCHWICCVDKLCLGPCHNMAHLIMIKY